MTGNARNGRYWPRSTTVLRPTTIFNPQGNVSVLTTAAAQSVGVVNHAAQSGVLTTVGVSAVTLSLHSLPTQIATFVAASQQAFVAHDVSVPSATFSAVYNSLTREPVNAFFVNVLTTGGGSVESPTLRASTPNVLTSLASSIVAVILARDIAISTSTDVGVSQATAVAHNLSTEVLSTLAASIIANTAGSSFTSVSTTVGVSAAAQSLKVSVVSALQTAGVAVETVNGKLVPIGSEVSVAVIPLTDSSHNAPITVSILSTVGVLTGAGVEHNTVPLASIVTMGADAPAITSSESLVEVLTTAGLDTVTALHITRNPILILRTSVGGVSAMQLGVEKMVEIEETQPGVTADV